jgi:hypothetical protein
MPVTDIDGPEEAFPFGADDLTGVFVETAFTQKEVEAALAEESRIGTGTGQCAFLAKAP